MQEVADRCAGEAGLPGDLGHGHSPLLIALNQELSGEDFGRLPIPLRVLGACSSSAHRDAVLQHSVTDREARDTGLLTDLGKGKALPDVQVDELSPLDREVLPRSCHVTQHAIHGRTRARSYAMRGASELIS